MDLGIEGLGPAIRIGIGGSAIVYRARQEKLNRDVAVKLLTNQDPSFVRRFEREAKMLGRLSRLPGIVTIHNSGFTANNEPYLILEYCPSSLLNRIYRDGPYPAEQAAQIIGQVAATVAEAQAEGVIHRDLKPANILLNEADEPLISDFGISSVLGATGNMSTSVGFTPGYVAPETLTGEQGESPVDVYALGATLFHLITGHAPFMESAAEASNLLALANRIDTEPVPDLRPDGVPDDICAAIEWAMAKDPNDRPTAKQLASILRPEPGARSASGLGSGPGSQPDHNTSGSPPSPGANLGPLPAVGPTRPVADAPSLAGVDPVVVNREAVSQANFEPPAAPLAPVGSDESAYMRAATPMLASRQPKRLRGRWVGAALVSGMGMLAFLAMRSADGPPAFDFPVATTVLPDFGPSTTGMPGLIGDTPGSVAAERPSTVGGYLDRWEAERARIIFNLEDQYGLGDDGVLRGPAGFEVDTTTCPSDWSNTDGVTGGNITLALAIPESRAGTVPPLANGMIAYFNWVNENGGIGTDGLQINTVLVDETDIGTDGRLAGELNTFVDQGLLFSLSTTETDAGLAARDALNESCIPQPFAPGRHPAWGDPIDHPWTTGLERSYRSEAAAWVSLIEDTFVEPVPVAALVVDSELGRIYEDGFRAAAAESDMIAGIEVIRHDPNAAILTPEIKQLTAGRSPVFIAMSAGRSCLLAIEGALGASLANPTHRILPSGCVSPIDYTSSVEAATDGWTVLDHGLQTTLRPTDDGFGPPGAAPGYDPFVLYDPFVEFSDNRLEMENLAPVIENHGLGFGLYGWAYHQALEIAARLPGGLTRTNFMLAQRAMSEMTAPLGVPGIGFGMNGIDDAYFLEDAQSLRYSWSDRVWIPYKVLDANGKTPPCRWEPEQGCLLP
ncbi:MAG: protein kinase domain-containing protein [Acidimicrobiales bacterium]